MCAAPTAPPVSRLAGYSDRDGRRRELVLLRTPRRSLLVIDRLAAGGADPRLVAEIGWDEPASNAVLVCSLYLADPQGRWCRSVTAEDLEAEPQVSPAPALDTHELLGPDGSRFRLEVVHGGARCPRELRWVRRVPVAHSGPPQVLSLRRTVAALESYEPARSITAAAVVAPTPTDQAASTGAASTGAASPGSVSDADVSRPVSRSTLAAELDRLHSSPIVLNRLLRGAVLGALKEGQTLSAIAMRCGRVKHDRRGNVSGETSWLGRRLGLIPEGGCRRPTPWVHSDVLALVARRGLGISPREVELG
ncbi:MAG TPA: hypothetical protein VGN69_01485 [Solirubrobacteraceae bacterium]|jgi:hypothetical protein|nr:hypothetical protein [Solirubrobacteraceae bacterium]